MSGGFKYCKMCDEDVSLSNFGTNGSPNTYKPLCKFHTLEYTRGLKEEKRKRLIKKNKVIDIPKKHFCKKCKKNKVIKEFDSRESIYNSDNEPLFLRYSTCRSCNDATKSPEKKKEYSKIARERRIENGKTKEYQIKHAPVRNALEKIKCKDPKYRMKKNLRHRAYEIMLMRGIRMKEKHKLVGMTYDEYEKYLEFMMRRIDKNMHMKNYAAYWNIDHVIPCDSFAFDTSDDPMISMCFSWFNTKPMKKELNISKLNKIDKKEIIDHIDKLYCYANKYNKKMIKYINKYYNYAKKYIK